MTREELAKELHAYAQALERDGVDTAPMYPCIAFLEGLEGR